MTTLKDKIRDKIIFEYNEKFKEIDTDFCEDLTNEVMEDIKEHLNNNLDLE